MLVEIHASVLSNTEPVSTSNRYNNCWTRIDCHSSCLPLSNQAPAIIS